MRLIVLAGHERQITKVQFNFEDDLLFTSAADKTVMLWDSETGERLGTFDGHNGTVSDFDVDHLTKFLVTGSGDQSVRIWECQTGKQIQHYSLTARINSVEWSCGSKYFLAASPQFTQKYPAVVHIFDNTADEQKIDMVDMKEQPISSVIIENRTKIPNFSIQKAVWSPLNEQIFALCADGTIRIIDVRKEQEIKSIMFDEDLKKKIEGNKDMNMKLTDFQYCDNYCSAVISGRNFEARMFDIRHWKVIRKYVTNRALNTIAIHPYLNCIAMGGGRESQQAALERRGGNYEALFYHTIFEEKIGTIETDCFSPLNTMAFSTDGSMFALGYEEGQVRLFTMDADFEKKFNKVEKKFTVTDDDELKDSDDEESD